MKIFEVRNAAEALPQVIDFLVNHGAYESSRNGKVFVAKTPVITVYSQPTEKVLFSQLRDANPFFHLMESMWMLAGCNDAKFLNFYVKDFGGRYGENGILHGAYGYRWRHSFGFDQLFSIVQKFRTDKTTRQCTLQMWDCSAPYHAHKGIADEHQNDLNGSWKDRPCNTQVFFRINNNKLDMTTTARSHDAYWGATGANAVHFTILQEYIAGMVGVEVGKFYQFSNNYHLYAEVYENLKAKCQSKHVITPPIPGLLNDNRYEQENFFTIPLVTVPKTFDSELQELMQVIRDMHEGKATIPTGTQDNDFLWETVYMMALAHVFYKQKNYDEALKTLMYVKSSDWMMAAREWILRRIK